MAAAERVPAWWRPDRPAAPPREGGTAMGLSHDHAHGTVTQRLIADHLVSGHMEPGEEIALRVDQTLTQDATGTLVMQELEALALDRVRTQVSVQYVDHNILQADER